MKTHAILCCWLLTLCNGSRWSPKLATWDTHRPSSHFPATSPATESKALAAFALTFRSSIPTVRVNGARIKSRLPRTRSASLPVMSSDDSDSWDELERLKNAVSLQRQVFGTEHVETLSAMSEYAGALLGTGRWAMAELVCEELLQLRRTMLGNEHPDVLKALSNYADVLTALLRWDQALPLHKESFELHRSILGPEHEDTLAALNSYIATLRKLNRTAEAQTLLQGLYETTKKSFGANHPRTLLAMTTLADVLIEKGQYSPIRLAEAERLKKEVLEVKRKVLGKGHPDTLDALKDYEGVLSAIAEEQAQEDESALDAIEELAEAKDKRERRPNIKALATLLKEPFKFAKNLLANVRIGQRS